VRAAARPAVGERARHTTFAARWRVPLSIAALVVVSTTVTLMVADRRAYVPDAGLASPPRAAPAEQQAPAAAEPSLPRARETTRAPQAAVPMAAKPEVGAKASGGEPAAGGVAQPDQPRADSLEDLAKAQPATPSPGIAQEAKQAPRERDAFKDEGASPKLRMQEVAPAREPPPSAPATSSDTLETRQLPTRPEDAAATGGVQGKADAPAPPAASTAAPKRARQAQVRTEQETQRAEGAEASRSVEDDPQRWVEHIRALRAAGKLQQAEDNLRDLRKRYPDFPLPADLAPPR